MFMTLRNAERSPKPYRGRRDDRPLISFKGEKE